MDEFIVEAVSLSELTSIRIGHDGKGSSDGWFLDKVIITEPQEQKEYPFLCNRWLASDEDDGLIVRDIPVGDTATLLKSIVLCYTFIRRYSLSLSGCVM